MINSFRVICTVFFSQNSHI